MTTETAALFPLPLTPFEQYMLADDRADYPMVFPLLWPYQGTVQRDAFKAAVTDALVRHPLLCAVVHRQGLGGWSWLPAEVSHPPIRWDRPGSPNGPAQVQGFDLKRECGLCIEVREGNGQGHLLFQFHHACCDGIGALRFFGDVMAAYARRVLPADRNPHLTPNDPKALLRRGAPRWGETPEPTGWLAAWRTQLGETWRWFVRQPSPLAIRSPSTRGTSTPAPGPGIHFHTFDRLFSRRLRAEAQRSGATLNDWLLCSLFLTLDAWNREYGYGKTGKWLRINMPTSLRLRADANMPAANVLGYAFLTRHAKQCRDRTSLLSGIQEETKAIRKWNLGQLFLQGLANTRRFPGALRLFTRGRRCVTTAVLTNLGDLTRRLGTRLPCKDGRVTIGDLVLERLIATPPLRPKTRAVFAIMSYARELTVCVRCDPHSFSDQDAQQLLTRYTHVLNQWIADSAL